MNNNNKSMLEEDDDNQSSSLREPTPAMIGPGSEFSTIHSQQSTSTISTFNHQRLSPLSRNKILDHHSLPSFINRPSLSDLTIPITTVSSSLDDYQHNVSTYIGSDTAADNKKPFESDLYLKLEEKNKTILVLTELVQKKEEEIEVLKADLDDYVSELGSVCDKFNRELDEIADIYTTDHQQPSRPSHPSPDMQLKKKLDMTLRERNQWQLKATELEYQLRALLLNQHHQLYYNSILNQINSTMKPRLQDETILTKKK
ncbi:uncharacterized protein BX663DRAFT_522127 [Cokeromyces recurvatus]|uniref:uncharacterized protein n=1 Tax=Cokeromyces recurvatus TaxID=90255 RepID=UPI00221F2E2B|nr:uncharacterized protein BX663DRAFT_522127 [Cokeromyces recurvatus]KAI7899300.1 hypothetical protein BX663DRAFT_522127 [Cokeromyces recurvatus]